MEITEAIIFLLCTIRKKKEGKIGQHPRMSEEEKITMFCTRHIKKSRAPVLCLRNLMDNDEIIYYRARPAVTENKKKVCPIIT